VIALIEVTPFAKEPMIPEHFTVIGGKNEQCVVELTFVCRASKGVPLSIER
jgi:hypothetical protein